MFLLAAILTVYEAEAIVKVIAGCQQKVKVVGDIEGVSGAEFRCVIRELANGA